MKKKPSIGALIFYVSIFALIAFCASQLFGAPKSVQKTYPEIIALFEEEKVESFTLLDGKLELTLKEEIDGSDTVRYQVPDVSLFLSDTKALTEEQYAKGIISEYDYLPDTQPSWFLTFLPELLLCAGLLVVMIILFNRMGGGAGGAMKFSKANARVGKTDKQVTFADVAGAEEEKAELQEIVEFLRDPEKFTKLGAKVPHGVLLVGPPGTGKTLLAKAVAGEAGVQFLSISGSDFVELYVGVGAGRVRDLFEQAKKMSPSIIFIDEIDAVGRHRGAGMGGGHDEREQTLNQLLVEMDGFYRNEGVIVMAATNRKDILDPALLRPGRFDRQIYIGKPDCRGREEILKVHARNKPLADTVDLHTVARATVGLTGADLENLLNEAALLSARNNRPCITMPDLEEALLKVMAGPQKKSHRVSEEKRRLTAYHEAGHAVAAHFQENHMPVQQITIIPRGQTGGLTLYLPEEDGELESRSEMQALIISALGGRVAEQLKLSDISVGASNDIKQATAIAHEMVTKYGMSEKLGAVSYDNDDEIFIGMSYGRTRSYSERTAGEIDEEVKRLVDEAYAKCKALLTAHDDKLEAVTQFLLAHDTMTRAQFEACMNGKEIPQTDDASIFAHFEKPEETDTADE